MFCGLNLFLVKKTTTPLSSIIKVQLLAYIRNTFVTPSYFRCFLRDCDGWRQAEREKLLNPAWISTSTGHYREKEHHFLHNTSCFCQSLLLFQIMKIGYERQVPRLLRQLNLDLRGGSHFQAQRAFCKQTISSFETLGIVSNLPNTREYMYA